MFKKEGCGRALLLLMVGAIAAACSNHQCTEAGCFDGFELAIEPALVEPGAYTFEIEAEDTFSCSATLDGAFHAASNEDCHVQGSSRGIIGVRVNEQHPTKVALRVLRDGLEIGRADVDLTYTTVRPNGEDCPPTCREASERVDLE